MKFTFYVKKQWLSSNVATQINLLYAKHEQIFESSISYCNQMCGKENKSK